MAGQDRAWHGMPGVVRGLHGFAIRKQDLDGRDKSGHGERVSYRPAPCRFFAALFTAWMISG
jgi:hypothetical protein